MAEANKDQPADTAIVFRIGLHLGDLIVDGDDLYGDGVNVAARLEAEAPPGGIVVSRAIREAGDGRLKAKLHALGELSLKNIERPIRAFRVEWEAADWKASAPAPEAAQNEPTAPVAPALALPDKPSIAVLPFQNMSGDPEQEYFADGVVEDIITALARFKSLFVIARNSSFSYKGKSPDIRQVGRELGVRYVLEGSIRKAANRVRVTGQLIDTLTGNHIWAERYDRVLEDIFAVQEEVTQAIVAAIAPEIAATEQTRAMRRRPEDIGAYEIALRAWTGIGDAHQTTDLDLMERAVEDAKKALALDPNSILAWQSLCFGRQLAVWHRPRDGPDERHEEALEAGDRAIALDGADARSHALRAHCAFTGRKFEQQHAALAQAARAHAMNPNDTFVFYPLGNLETSVGDAERVIEQCQQILRLNPRDNRIHLIYTLLAYACVGAKRWAEGAAWAARTVNDAPRNVTGHANLIVCLVGMGEIEKAKAAFSKARELFPQVMERFVAGGRPSRARPEVNAYVRVLWRIAAGLEDPSGADALR